MVSAGIKVGERVKSGAKSYVKGGGSNNVQKKAKAQTSHGSRENTTTNQASG